MRFFFYGTLMDVDVLSAVTGRRFRPEELVPAALAGWRCAAVPGARYPALVAAEGRLCEGVVVEGVDRRMANRLAIYEGPQYRQVSIEVETDDGRLAAAVFVPTPAMRVAKADWSFDGWRRRHKPDYLRRLASSAWQAT